MFWLYQQGCDTTYKEKCLFQHVAAMFQAVLKLCFTHGNNWLSSAVHSNHQKKKKDTTTTKKIKSFIFDQQGDVSIWQDDHWNQTWSGLYTDVLRWLLFPYRAHTKEQIKPSLWTSLENLSKPTVHYYFYLWPWNPRMLLLCLFYQLYQALFLKLNLTGRPEVCNAGAPGETRIF